MALIDCIECGAQVSDKAASCPKCGHPVENTVAFFKQSEESPKLSESEGKDQPPPFSEKVDSSDEPPPFRPNANASYSGGSNTASPSSFANFSAASNDTKTGSTNKGWAVGGAVAAATVLGVIVFQANASPKIVAIGNNSDESCSVFPLEYCVRVFCKFRNEGGASGFSTVAASISNRNTGSFIAKKVSSVSLGKGQTDIVSFDFPEAEVSDGMNYNTLCFVE
jgi:zinc-ribbon domain